MEIHYNAFISYRHHPDDIRVASEIHRALEHYKVPKAIRHKTKGITRLFRDKEELPITSDLSNDITRALKNSDYLIVICSTHTKESNWVLREIETFLKTHDRNKVLTVLVDGEPYDTIPEILLTEEKTDPVTGKVETVPIEPLSCDWRIPRRQARREELPRLAAALMGCGYDELRQRERQYRTQRMVAVFSAALAASLCLSAYFIHTSLQIKKANDELQIANQRIRENLEQALENQSLFLANESTRLLENGDRLTAMALAMEALPEYPGERPYVAAAELALAQALGAYDSEGTLAAVGAMDCSALVKDFIVTPDAKTVYILDARNVVTVWNGETMKLLGSAQLAFQPDAMAITRGGNLVIHEIVGQVACVSPEGKILWTMDGCDDLAMQDDTRLLVLSDESGIAGNGSNYVIRIYDADTGREVRQPVVFSNPTGEGGWGTFLTDRFAGENLVALGFRRQSEDGSQDLRDIAVLDCGSGACRYLTTLIDSYVECAAFTEEDNLLVMAYNPDDCDPSRGIFLNMTTTGEIRGTLYCLNGETGGELWTAQISSYIPSTFWSMDIIPGSGNLLFVYENVFHVIDIATGQILARCESASAPLWVGVGETNAYAILTDGSTGLFSYEDGTCSTIPYMKSGLIAAQRCGDTFFVSEYLGTQVVVYHWLNDQSCQAYEGEVEYLYNNSLAVGAKCFALEAYGDLYVYDAEGRVQLWNRNGSSEGDVQLLGFAEDGNTLRCVQVSRNPMELLTYDAETGECHAMEIPEEWNGELLYNVGQFRLEGEKLYYTARAYSSQNIFLLQMDVNTGAVESWYICTATDKVSSYDQETVLLGTVGSYVLIWENSTETVHEIDIVTYSVRKIATGVDSLPAVQAFDESLFVLAVGHEIQLRRCGGEMEMRADLGEKRVGALCIREDQILALCDDGELYRYDQSGTQLSRTVLCVYTDFYSDLANDPSQVTWSFTEDGDLIINCCGLGNIVDCETWQTRAYISSFVGYVPLTDTVLVNSSLSWIDGLAGYPRYSTEDIVTMAREALGDFKLSPEQEAEYGLLEE